MRVWNTRSPTIPVLGPPHPPNTADCSDVTHFLKTFQVAAIGQAREKDKGISEQNMHSQLSKGVQFSYVGLAWFSCSGLVQLRFSSLVQWRYGNLVQLRYGSLVQLRYGSLVQLRYGSLA